MELISASRAVAAAPPGAASPGGPRGSRSSTHAGAHGDLSPPSLLRPPAPGRCGRRPPLQICNAGAWFVPAMVRGPAAAWRGWILGAEKGGPVTRPIRPPEADRELGPKKVP
eukprot:scaffold225_cov388-Prasinococcus_capsulatus_cf.AAC.25